MSCGENCALCTCNEITNYYRRFQFPWSRRERNLKNEKVERDLGIFCVAFKDKSVEWNYLHQPDYIFKYSVALGWGIGCCLIYIQSVNNSDIFYTGVVINIIAFFVLTFLLFICWYKKVCWWHSGQNEQRSYGKLSCAIFHLFEKIQHSFVLRLTVYMMIILCYYMVISLILVSYATTHVFNIYIYIHFFCMPKDEL